MPLSLTPSTRLSSRLGSVAVGAARVSLGALPFGLRRDILYLWATFRLRNRPLKMCFFIVLLGGVIFAWQWIGRQWLEPRLLQAIAPIRYAQVKDILIRTAGAIFSATNILSCIAIFIMAWTLRRLLKEGHIENLLLAPRIVRPSSLYYALASRYLPLSLVALLIIYLDRDRSPFSLPPFNLPPEDASPDLWNVYWAGFSQASIAFFAVTNLFMDMSLAYWIFVRWRVTYPTAAAAMIFVGLVTPIGLMWLYRAVDQRVTEGLRLSTGVYARINEAFALPPPYYTLHRIAETFHYTAAGLVSVLIGLLVLWNLDARWFRMVRNVRVDPVLLKKID